MTRLLLSLALVALIPVTGKAALRTAEGIPQGFEQLAEPQASMVTVNYGGETLGRFAAHLTPSTLTFDAPEAVVNAIPALIDRPGMRALLSKPQPHNAQARCGKQQTMDCGRLSPEIAALIYTPSTLTAELFINPAYLSVEDGTGPRFLGLPERQLSSVLGFNGAVVGSTQNTPNYALTSNAITSFGETRLTTQSTLSDEGLRFDTVAAGMERNGWEAQGGLFRSRSMQLIPDRDMAGVSYGSSIRTRLDAHKTAGNAVIVYLPRRSIVSVYREGRVYSSRAYEAGNQTVDTTELPEGAYNIQLKVQEADGSTREETRFFAKSPDIPPPGTPTYYMQAGVLRAPASNDRTIPDISDKPLVRAGIVQRVADNMGLGIDGLWMNDRLWMEAGTFYLEGGTQIRGTLLGSSKGDSGAQASFLKTKGKWSIASDARALWTDEKAPVYMGNNAPLPEFTLDTPVTSYKQLTGSLSYAATPSLTVGARASYSDSNGMRQESYGPNMSWYLWRKAESMLTFDADGGRTNDQTVANAMLRFTMRFGNYGVSTSGGFAGGDGSRGITGSARGWYDHSTPDEAVLVGSTVQADRRAASVGVDGDYRNSFGRMRGLVQQAFTDEGAVTNYSGNFSFNSAHVDNALYVGGDHTDMSAVVVSLKGDAGVPMNILVGGVARGVVEPGTSHTVYLPPYQRYSIRLVPARKELVAYDSAARTVTLYPGNVSHLNWEANRLYIVLAKLVNDKGEPVANAQLQEGDGRTTTSAHGRVQVQLTQPERLTLITPENTACEIALPAMVPVNGVLHYTKPLVCETIPLS